jgi:dimeric dUTPase (all-alpha-NTP-PPase superfamily)
MNAAQANAMLMLQDRMNLKVDPQWITAGYPWLRAIALEGAEAMEHWGWKWWKKQTPDLDQFKIELVDIWHFALSHFMVTQPTMSTDLIVQESSNPARHITFDGRAWDLDDAEMDMRAKLDLLIGMAATNRFSISLFHAIMDEINMTWDDLYVAYVAKNVLNFFRQDNGYKTGTYIKSWGGKEDNVRLAEIVGSLDSRSPTFDDNLYRELALAYRDVLEQHGRVTEAGKISITPIFS